MEMIKSAVISDDLKYRYRLERRWGEGAPLVFVMLNPSTATAVDDDNTIRRCIGFAQSWGYPAVVVVNLFAYRCTDPRELLSARDPIGPENDRYIMDAAYEADKLVVAWGAYKTGRAASVLSTLRSYGVKTYLLRLNKDGSPGHPLYQPAETKPTELP